MLEIVLYVAVLSLDIRRVELSDFSRCGNFDIILDPRVPRISSSFPPCAGRAMWPAWVTMVIGC